ncbi:coiled-coil domain-containing protein 186 isoform X2 [Plodia interpunctella]|uniref:coiled-coil domain-containing protein 186 isoform X2 n=1 Tax=Plodia interpunctella TaxID=58824 RepID=UPI0023677E70|nr:coiled-coil domain-containing protein 186 isoform X2 [Plodia interpunctella]
MSEGSEDMALHVDNVSVDTSKNNGSLFEITNDSGVDTYDSCSAACPLSSDSEASPIKDSATISKSAVSASAEVDVENEIVSANSSPVSISPDNNDRNEFPAHGNRHISSTNVITEPTKINLSPKEIVMTDTMIKVEEKRNSYESLNTDSNHLKSKAITTSTTSLDENKSTINVNSAMCKSPYSRSAENISMTEPQNENLNLSTNELNTEKILSEFANQKSKVGATQKIPESPQVTQILDVGYSRLPKELLSQDLGSIVKNVHGIFSSVSGSLKSAYNNSHRVLPHQKAPMKIVKNLPNSKVMKEIFEDESIQENSQVNIEKTNVDVENSNLGSTSENDGEEVSADTLRMQVESLEKLLADQKKENSLLKDRVKHHIDELHEKDHSFKELELKLDLMGKRVEQAEREKDAAVMRYASVECTAIEAKRAAEKATAAEKAAVHEMELLNGKLKSAHVEKQRICQLYDDKCHELSNSEREVSKLRDELRELEGRLKWTQSKLRAEMDAYKESSERAEKLSQLVSELEAARDAAAASAADSARGKLLESELKECRAAFILCRHEKEEIERKMATISQQLDACRRERDSNSEALTRTTAEVEALKLSNLRLEEEAAELAALRAEAALSAALGVQLERETERANKAEEALSQARAQTETCAGREARALEHAARLTALHVAERALHADHHGKVQALTADNTSLRERLTNLEQECSKLTSALTDETERRNNETRQLARRVAELTEKVSDANKRLEWEKGENAVLKKKHASAIKELNRELQRALKRCEQLEAKLPAPEDSSTRTGSVTSLSSGEGAAPDEKLQNGHDAIPEIQIKSTSLIDKIFSKHRSPDRQALIERIVSLQRAAARRAERCEFLEEHARQLTAELRRKARLLRALLCALPAGAVADRARDLNKKEMAQLGGGAMAAVWGGSTDGMTLELSLEMNRRLQAVLEDALLKNITLKENMDTLGAEISRLKEQIKPDEK